MQPKNSFYIFGLPVNKLDSLQINGSSSWYKCSFVSMWLLALKQHIFNMFKSLSLKKWTPKEAFQRPKTIKELVIGFDRKYGRKHVQIFGGGGQGEIMFSSIK